MRTNALREPVSTVNTRTSCTRQHKHRAHGTHEHIHSVDSNVDGGRNGVVEYTSTR